MSPSLQAAQLIAGSLVGLALGLVAGGVLRTSPASALLGTHDSLLIGLMLAAAFSLGAFLTWVFLSF